MYAGGCFNYNWILFSVQPSSSKFISQGLQYWRTLSAAFPQYLVGCWIFSKRFQDRTAGCTRCLFLGRIDVILTPLQQFQLPSNSLHPVPISTASRTSRANILLGDLALLSELMGHIIRFSNHLVGSYSRTRKHCSDIKLFLRIRFRQAGEGNEGRHSTNPRNKGALSSLGIGLSGWSCKKKKKRLHEVVLHVTSSEC